MSTKSPFESSIKFRAYEDAQGCCRAMEDAFPGETFIGVPVKIPGEKFDFYFIATRGPIGNWEFKQMQRFVSGFFAALEHRSKS